MQNPSKVSTEFIEQLKAFALEKGCRGFYNSQVSIFFCTNLKTMRYDRHVTEQVLERVVDSFPGSRMEGDGVFISRESKPIITK